MLLRLAQATRSNMNRLFAFIGWAVESAMLGVLLWRFTGLYDLDFPFFFLLTMYPVFVFAHWAVLRNGHLASRVRRTLSFLTGPSVLLSLYMVLGLNAELKKVAMVGGATKEMVQAAIKEDVPPK